MVVNTGSGEEAGERKGRVNMAEVSERSQNSARRSTRKTVPLTQEEALQILQESFRVCEESGVVIQVETDNHNTQITLHDVAFFHGNLVRANIGTE